jgi:hypothetical protein
MLFTNENGARSPVDGQQWRLEQIALFKRLKDLETEVHKLIDEVNEMELRIDAFQTVHTWCS